MEEEGGGVKLELKIRFNLDLYFFYHEAIPLSSP